LLSVPSSADPLATGTGGLEDSKIIEVEVAGDVFEYCPMVPRPTAEEVTALERTDDRVGEDEMAEEAEVEEVA